MMQQCTSKLVTLQSPIRACGACVFSATAYRPDLVVLSTMRYPCYFLNCPRGLCPPEAASSMTLSII